MKQSRAKLAGIIAQQTLKSGSTKKLSREIAAYLIVEHRTNDLESVLRDVQADWAAAGIVDVVAESAHPLTATVKKEIERQVKQIYPSAKQIIISEVAKPEVIAGVRLNLPNQQFDLSVESKLNKFKQLTIAGKD